MNESGIFNFFRPKPVKAMPFRILLVDDPAILLYVFKNLLERVEGIQVVGLAESG